jgi:hypothetical protein
MLEPSDRECVKGFFQFPLDRERIQRRPARYLTVMLFAILAALGLYLASRSSGARGIHEGAAGAALLTGFLAFLLGFAVDSWMRELAYRSRQRLQDDNHKIFIRLAGETRKVMSHDAASAFLRLFARTQLERAELQPLHEQYILPEEQGLFQEDSLETRLGDLFNKSIRTISPAEPSDGKRQEVLQIKWRDRVEWFSPRVRVMLVLLPRKTELVICDATIDLVTGSLREEILRIPYDRIVTIRLLSDCKAELMSKQRARQEAGWATVAEDGPDPRAGHDGGDDNALVLHEEIAARMIITLTDGTTVGIPCSYVLRRSTGVSAPLDRGDELTEDERRVDRIVNELNRMVETAGTVRGPAPRMQVAT